MNAFLSMLKQCILILLIEEFTVKSVYAPPTITHHHKCFEDEFGIQIGFNPKL